MTAYLIPRPGDIGYNSIKSENIESITSNGSGDEFKFFLHIQYIKRLYTPRLNSNR